MANLDAMLEYFKHELTNKEILAYVQKPFNLEEGSLYRCSLIKYHSNKYRLIIVLHHVIIDGSSFDYFCNELTYYNNPLYQSIFSIKKQISDISKLSKKLSEYIETNRDSSKLFWQTKLANVEPLSLNFLKYTTNQSCQKELLELGNIGAIRFYFNTKVLLELNQVRSDYSITPYLFG
ncbi:condensation domain-containing protein [Candidatus Tisiphia endosymbiont of Nemotelus uliginosus]|uniref:condensation domain-containing protein n=1 Tax=Candidatus Tisiphia endosymbiont of Nemotelus uliginosus TaxID=3077926 RepID=UPI0035C8898E